MSDRPPDEFNHSPDSSDHEDAIPEASFGRKFNPNWQEEVFGSAGQNPRQSSFRTLETPDNMYVPDEYPERPWNEVFRDFITQGNEERYEYLLNEPTANVEKGIIWYAVSSLVYFLVALVILGVVFMIIPSDEFTTTRTTRNSFGRTVTTEETIDPAATLVQQCIGAPFQIGFSIVGVIIFMAIVHVAATSVAGGMGEYKKLVYGIFSIRAASQLGYLGVVLILGPIMLVAYLLSPILVLGLVVLIMIPLIIFSFYLLYLEVLWVKVVYSIDWGGACLSWLMPAIVIFGLFCSCAFCISSGNGS